MKMFLRLSFNHLKIKKLRTCLTISGIVIGVMSLVIMISIGIGYKTAVLSELKKNNPGVDIYVTSQDNRRKDRIITDKTIEKISKLEDVQQVFPMLDGSGTMELNGYGYYGPIYGVTREYMEDLGLSEGELPCSNGSRPEILCGGGFKQALFSSTKSVKYKDSTAGKEPQVGKRFTYESQYKLSISGITADPYDYDLYTDIDTLKMFLKRQMVDGCVPGQPKDKDDKPYPMWVYDSLIVRVDTVENAKRVSDAINEMGFMVDSNIEIIEDTENMITKVQIILAVIGTVAAVVAIIGIVNTMVTAVYDRIKEIGLLKMIGSDSDDIVFMFLFESGLLGAIGGVIGVLLSFLLSLILNPRLAKIMSLSKESRIIGINWKIVLGAIVVTIIVSILAGIFPSRFAVKVKPLEAIN